MFIIILNLMLTLLILLCYNHFVVWNDVYGGIPKSGWRDRSWKPGGRANGAGVRIPFPPPFRILYRGVEQLVARRAHNPKVEGSSPFPATMVPWCSWLTRLPVTQKIAGSSPVGTAIFFGFIAQSVEQGTENPCVAGSIPAGATI